MPTASLFLVLVLLVLWVARSVRTHLALRHFGGHWSSGWSRLWLLRTQGSGQMHKRFTAINNQYGSTARIAPAMLITTDADLVRRMSAVRSNFTRGQWYSCLKLHPERENIVSLVDEHQHAFLRAHMAPGYAGKANKHLEGDVDEQLLKLFDLLQAKYLTQADDGVYAPVDLARVTSFFTLDTISKIAFGKTFGFLENDEDPFGYLENLEEFLPALIVFGVYTELSSILKLPLLKSILPKSTDKRGLGRVMGFAQERVRERCSTWGEKRDDMLGSFIEEGLTPGELESETLTQITAGSDSTASAVRMTLHFISTSPRILERLLAEMENAIGRGQVTRPVITDSQARQLPYLQACIKEGLRMYPPVTGLLAKRVPEPGVTIEVDGVEKHVPGGVQIAWNPWGMMRNSAIFGIDSDIFRPERWLPRNNGEAERERLSRMNDTVFLCFGYGRFGCLGRGVALMELNKAIVETLLRFNLQPCSLAKPFQEAAVGFYIHKDMNFVVTARRGKDVVAPEEESKAEAAASETMATDMARFFF